MEWTANPTTVCTVLFERADINKNGLIDDMNELSVVTESIFTFIGQTDVDWASKLDTVPGGIDAATGDLNDPIAVGTFIKWFSMTFPQTGLSIAKDGTTPMEFSGIHATSHVHEDMKEAVGGEVQDRTVSLANGTLKICAPDFGEGESDHDVVLFAEVETCITEGDKPCYVPIVRRGSEEAYSTIEIDWYTENLNLSPENYEDQKGTVKMAAGQKNANIEIRIRDDESWSLETKQYVFISEVRKIAGQREVKIGDLKRGTVVILNDDSFPHGRDPEAKNMDGHFIWSESQIVYSFCTHLYQSLHHEASMGAILKCYPALHWLMTQLLMLLSINLAFKNYQSGSDAGDNTEFRKVIYGLGAAYMISLMLWMFASWEYIELRLGGKSRMILKKACVGTMLQLTEEVSHEYTAGTVLSITNTGVDNAVKFCWTGMFGIWDDMVSFAVVTAFTAYVVRATPYLLLIPVIQLFFDYLIYVYRSPLTVEKQQQAIEKDDAVQRALMDVCDSRDLVTMYKASGMIITDFSKHIGGANKSLWQADRYASDTIKIFMALHSVFILACFVGGGELLYDDPSSFKIGNFVALMGIIFKYDGLVTNFFGCLDEMQTGYTYVRRVANLLNQDTRRKQVLRFEDAMKVSINTIGLSDFHNEEDITLNRVMYEYIDHWAGQKTTRLIGPFSFSAEQGQLLSVDAPKHTNATGTKTLLRLLARQMLPTRGFITYPGNLRVRYMPANPILFAGGLMYNLRFGLMNKPKEQQYSDEQVWEVWSLFGGSDSLKGQDDYDVDKLSDAMRNIAAFCRAILSDADFYLCGGGLDVLGTDLSIKVLKVIRGWIRDRGLTALLRRRSKTPPPPDNLPDQSICLRKKKTFIFSTKHANLCNEADAVIMLT